MSLNKLRNIRYKIYFISCIPQNRENKATFPSNASSIASFKGYLGLLLVYILMNSNVMIDLISQLVIFLINSNLVTVFYVIKTWAISLNINRIHRFLYKYKNFLSECRTIEVIQVTLKSKSTTYESRKLNLIFSFFNMYFHSRKAD